MTKEAQDWVAGAVADCGVYPSKAQAEQLKTMQESGELTEGRSVCSPYQKRKGQPGRYNPGKEGS